MLTSGFQMHVYTHLNTHHTHRRTQRRKRKTTSHVDDVCIRRCHLLRKHHGTEKWRVCCVSDVLGVMVQKLSWTRPLLSDFSFMCHTWAFLKLAPPEHSIDLNMCSGANQSWLRLVVLTMSGHSRWEGLKATDLRVRNTVLRSYRQCGPCSLSSPINSHFHFRTYKAWAIWFSLTPLSHPVLHISEIRVGAKDEVLQVSGWWMAEVGPSPDWKHSNQMHFLRLPAGSLLKWHCAEAWVSVTVTHIVSRCIQSSGSLKQCRLIILRVWKSKFQNGSHSTKQSLGKAVFCLSILEKNPFTLALSGF